MRNGLTLMLGLAALALVWGLVAEEESPASFPAMTPDRLNELVRRVDEQALRSEAGNQWQLSINDRTLLIIIDESADRMRVMTPIVEAALIDPDLMKRTMQANFDSALDARYAIAQDLLWGVFIHPLSDLSAGLFLSGLGQVVNVAETFGTSFTSGELVYGGGDNAQMQRELIERLKKLESTHEA